MFLEVALAQADRLRGDLGQLVVADELHRVLEREPDRRREQDRLKIEQKSLQKSTDDTITGLKKFIEGILKPQGATPK